MEVINTNEASPGSPISPNSGLSHWAITAIMPKWLSRVTANDMGMVILTNHNPVLSATGTMVLTDFQILCIVVSRYSFIVSGGLIIISIYRKWLSHSKYNAKLSKNLAEIEKPIINFKADSITNP